MYEFYGTMYKHTSGLLPNPYEQIRCVVKSMIIKKLLKCVQYQTSIRKTNFILMRYIENENGSHLSLYVYILYKTAQIKPHNYNCCLNNVTDVGVYTM